ncbi:MAG TPA: hypothetical protein EYG68_08500 [Leucothrix mucor]|nr:hypothetical protein [Leucothrix mucor]
MKNVKKEQAELESYLSKSCGGKFNKFESCAEEKESDCPCSSAGESGNGKVDLVILVDSSGSMGGAWKAINDASKKLESAINEKCGAEVIITRLFLDTKFDGSSSASGTAASSVESYGFISHEEYIRNASSYRSGAIDYMGTFETNDPSHSGGEHAEGEEGSRGIADVSSHFPWEKNHCRSILYISDEWLDSGGGGSIGSLASIPTAVNAANSNSVTVFTHLIGSNTDMASHYTQLAESTGGSAHIGDSPSADLYIELVSDAACNCGKGCVEIETPEIKPCISISWGDSDCDCLETDDFEILCISVCNCYSNIAFSDFTINMIEITNSDGKAIANLPDGTPSVQAVPIGPFCFGTIPPCEDGEASCVSREFVINTRGAKDGDYKVQLHGVCFNVSFDYHQETCLQFTLCKS